MPRRFVGRVVTWRSDKGFGFIGSESPSKPDIFIHIKNLQCHRHPRDPTEPSLCPDQLVEFEVEIDAVEERKRGEMLAAGRPAADIPPSKELATNMTCVGGTPLPMHPQILNEERELDRSRANKHPSVLAIGKKFFRCGFSRMPPPHPGMDRPGFPGYFVALEREIDEAVVLFGRTAVTEAHRFADLFDVIDAVMIDKDPVLDPRARDDAVARLIEDNEVEICPLVNDPTRTKLAIVPPAWRTAMPEEIARNLLPELERPFAPREYIDFVTSPHFQRHRQDQKSHAAGNNDRDGRDQRRNDRGSDDRGHGDGRRDVQHGRDFQPVGRYGDDSGTGRGEGSRDFQHEGRVDRAPGARGRGRGGADHHDHHDVQHGGRGGRGFDPPGGIDSSPGRGRGGDRGGRGRGEFERLGKGQGPANPGNLGPRLTGKTLGWKGGFGFITVDEEHSAGGEKRRDVIVVKRDLPAALGGDGTPLARDGCHVAFDLVEEGGGRARAVNVELISAAPLSSKVEELAVDAKPTKSSAVCPMSDEDVAAVDRLIATKTRCRGRCVDWKPARAFGFIAWHDAPVGVCDLFAHREKLRHQPTANTIVPRGQEVEFTIARRYGRGPETLAAVDVVVLDNSDDSAGPSSLAPAHDSNDHQSFSSSRGPNSDLVPATGDAYRPVTNHHEHDLIDTSINQRHASAGDDHHHGAGHAAAIGHAIGHSSAANAHHSAIDHHDRSNGNHASGSVAASATPAVFVPSVPSATPEAIARWREFWGKLRLSEKWDMLATTRWADPTAASIEPIREAPDCAVLIEGKENVSAEDIAQLVAYLSHGAVLLGVHVGSRYVPPPVNTNPGGETGYGVQLHTASAASAAGRTVLLLTAQLGTAAEASQLRAGLPPSMRVETSAGKALAVRTITISGDRVLGLAPDVIASALMPFGSCKATAIDLTAAEDDDVANDADEKKAFDIPLAFLGGGGGGPSPTRAPKRSREESEKGKEVIAVTFTDPRHGAADCRACLKAVQFHMAAEWHCVVSMASPAVERFVAGRS